MNDSLGNRMKEQYENRTRILLPRRTYTIIRLDGKAFHNLTRGLDKPFDKDFMWIMDLIAMEFCKEIQGAVLTYTQSDEISVLLTDFEKETTEAWFNGNIQKIVSISASLATYHFNENIKMLAKYQKKWFIDIDNRGDVKYGLFDARVFTIPDPIEVENYFISRQKDAIRNSLAMYAQSFYSHKELNGKSQVDMHNMIYAKGKNWNSLSNGFKRGRTVTKALLNGEWTMGSLDFIKDRESLRRLIPKII